MFSVSDEKSKYEPLGGKDFELESDVLQGADALGQLDRQRKKFKLSPIHLIIIGTELILAMLLVIGFVILRPGQRLSARELPLDGLVEVGAYNTTMNFHNNSDLLRGTAAANDYWKKLLDGGGVVSLNTEWALEQGLQESATSPTDSSQSIYQIDVFHALHCLNSLRINLMADEKPEFDEKHLTHCLDYIRHQLLCHPDLTLVHTNDLEEFVLTDSHQCRDYGAVVDWVHRHRWVEFREWFNAKGQQ